MTASLRLVSRGRITRHPPLWSVLALGWLLHPCAAKAEGTAQCGAAALMPETVLSVDVLPGDAALTIAAHNAENADVVGVRVTDPAGLVFDYTLEAGAGQLDDVLLPATIADPLSISVVQGTYQIQFDHEVSPFDISVLQETEQVVEPSVYPAEGGRVFTTNWQMSGEVTEEGAVSVSYYVRAEVGDDEYLWKLNLDGFAGGHSCVIANGLGLPGSLARSSQLLSVVDAEVGATLDRFEFCDQLAQYPIYLSVPNRLRERPQAPAIGSTDVAGCGAAIQGVGGELMFAANLPATFEVVIDTDRDAAFDPLSDDAVLSGVATVGSNVVSWDGLDAQGVEVPASPQPYAARIYLRLGEFHFTAVDVETANPGIRIVQIDPGDFEESAALMYWDDRAILANGTDNPPDPAVTIPDGVSSGEYAHNWGDFSDTGSSGIGNDAFIDTWVYGSQVARDAEVFVLEGTGDADSDGLADARECQIGTTYNDADTDDDTILDGEEVSSQGELIDTDGDSIANVFDSDDDGDGVATALEEPDPDGDGRPVDARDSDNDAIPDFLDSDDDGDGTPTAGEDLDGDGDPSNDDADGNGTPDYLDPGYPQSVDGTGGNGAGGNSGSAGVAAAGETHGFPPVSVEGGGFGCSAGGSTRGWRHPALLPFFVVSLFVWIRRRKVRSTRASLDAGGFSH